MQFQTLDLDIKFQIYNLIIRPKIIVPDYTVCITRRAPVNFLFFYKKKFFRKIRRIYIRKALLWNLDIEVYTYG